MTIKFENINVLSALASYASNENFYDGDIKNELVFKIKDKRLYIFSICSKSLALFYHIPFVSIKKNPKGIKEINFALNKDEVQKIISLIKVYSKEKVKKYDSYDISIEENMCSIEEYTIATSPMSTRHTLLEEAWLSRKEGSATGIPHNALYYMYSKIFPKIKKNIELYKNVKYYVKDNLVFIPFWDNTLNSLYAITPNNNDEP